MNYIGTIFSYCWSLFSIGMTFGEFTITFGQVFLFSIIVGLTCTALFRYLWG